MNKAKAKDKIYDSYTPPDTQNRIRVKASKKKKSMQRVFQLSSILN
jgi:hypothetical protein